MTEEEAKAEYKHRQEVLDAARTMIDDFAEVGDVVSATFSEVKALRANLTATQARCTQLIDEVRRLRRLASWAAAALYGPVGRDKVAHTLEELAPEGSKDAATTEVFNPTTGLFEQKKT